MHGLAMGGGGAKGAFEVGVLEYIVEKISGYEPLVLTGTSVGALNAAWLAQAPVGRFKEGVWELKSMWLDIEGDKSVFKKRTFGMFAGLYRPSFYIQDALRKKVYADIDPGEIGHSGRKVSVAAVSLKTGKVRYINGSDPLFRDGVLASSAFPVFFEPVRIEGVLYTDGGVRDILPLERAYEMGATFVDAITCSPREAFHCKPDPTAIDIFHATIDSMSNEIVTGDLLRKARWLFEPPANLLENSLDFDPTKIRKNIQVGYDLAKHVLG